MMGKQRRPGQQPGCLGGRRARHHVPTKRQVDGLTCISASLPSLFILDSLKPPEQAFCHHMHIASLLLGTLTAHRGIQRAISSS